MILALDHLLVVGVHCVVDGNVDRLGCVDLVADIEHEPAVARVLLGDTAFVRAFDFLIVLLVIVTYVLRFVLGTVYRVTILFVLLKHWVNRVHLRKLQLESENVLRVSFHAVESKSVLVDKHLFTLAASTGSTIYFGVISFAASRTLVD